MYTWLVYSWTIIDVQNVGLFLLSYFFVIYFSFQKNIRQKQIIAYPFSTVIFVPCSVVLCYVPSSNSLPTKCLWLLYYFLSPVKASALRCLRKNPPSLLTFKSLKTEQNPTTTNESPSDIQASQAAILFGFFPLHMLLWVACRLGDTPPSCSQSILPDNEPPLKA